MCTVMFDTEKFICEIQQHLTIWDVSSKLYIPGVGLETGTYKHLKAYYLKSRRGSYTLTPYTNIFKSSKLYKHIYQIKFD